MTSSTLVVELFPGSPWVGTIAYCVFVAGFVFYDTILYQRFTPWVNFFIVVVGVQVLVPVVEFVFFSLVAHRGANDQPIGVGRPILALLFSAIVYLLLRQMTNRPVR